MTLNFVHTAGLILLIALEKKVKKINTCERCCCIDTIDNPILEVLDAEGEVEEYICMMCYAEEIDERR